MADLEVGQEIKIRARELYDKYGNRVVFSGTLTALGALTADAVLHFNGITLMVADVPLEMVAHADQGIEVE